MNRQSPFSFECKRCSRCCPGKTIKVNPFEVARLAAGLGVDTSTFIRQYTVEQGTVLRRDDDETCIFLDEHGCSVHPDRPFVCRLYPLKRHVGASGESFSTMELDPGCEGEWGTAGTVESYLAEQEAQDYIAAVDAYLEITVKIFAALEQIMAGMEETSDGSEDEGFPEALDPDEISGWLDIDAMLQRHGYGLDRLKETNPAAKMLKHLDLIEIELDRLKGKGNDEKE